VRVGTNLHGVCIRPVSEGASEREY